METSSEERQLASFTLNGNPQIAYSAVRFKVTRDRQIIPVVGAPALATLLLTIICDPGSSYLAFAIDAVGRCTVQDVNDRICVLLPSSDGCYDLDCLRLDWTEPR